jgi:Tol biopolymer transport system component/DNA-binding winged helix-turn-helix (wHTH) protein
MEIDELETGALYQFDSYTLDPDARTLRYGDKLVDLTPKVFTTLLVLVENRDKVLTKDELLTIIWPDQFVDQSNLSQNISVLRRSLGETETGKKYIATFPGRGYRFVGRVEVTRHREEDHVPPPYPASPATNAFKAIPVQEGPGSGSDSRKNMLRYWNSTSIIALCVVIIVAIVTFAIGANIRHSRDRSIAENNAPLKVYARMNAGLTQPSLSRDGKTVAFVAMDLSGTQSVIYIQSQGDIQPHRLVSDSGQFSSPTWSPDGSQLAFLHFEPDTAELVIFDMHKQSSRVLTRLFAHRYGLNFRHLDWSPDGKFLVVDDKTQDSEPFSLYLIYIDSGQRVRLTYPDSDMIGDVSPRVSPDGTKVAFIRDIYLFEQEVYVTSVRGRTYQRVASDPTLISDVGWKTGSILALARPNQKESIASQVNSDRALQFSVAQNGQKVVFSNYNPDLDIWSINITNPSGGWAPIIQAPGENIRPSVSPDGKLLAFLSNVSGKFQIWVSQLDGTNASAVPTGTLAPTSFCWSSDGKSLIFSPQHIHGLYEIPARGNAPVRQISSIYTDPQSDNDGQSLFARAHFFLYRVPLKGGNAQEVTEQGGAPIAQSHDGRYLYFSQGRMSTTIARLDLRTGHQDELTRSLAPGYADTWALSSSGIYFLGQEKNQIAVRFLDFATHTEKHIADFPGELPQVEMSGFGISPDGKRLWAVRADPMPSDMETTMFR